MTDRVSAEVDLAAVSATTGGSIRLSGYLARPAGLGPWPGVVVLHEALGINDAVRRQVERVAEAGYLAIAPALFADGGVRRCLVPTLRALRSGVGRPFADIEAARRWLTAQPECNGKLGVIGFCMGGAFALATAGAGWAVAASNYGMLPDSSAFEQACPIVGNYGGKDPVLKNATAKLDAMLAAANVEHDIKEYPNAGHAFMNHVELGPSAIRPLLRVIGIKPDPASAADAWARIDRFFAKHLS